jgi:hypothetical protein
VLSTSTNKTFSFSTGRHVFVLDKDDFFPVDKEGVLPRSRRTHVSSLVQQ